MAQPSQPIYNNQAYDPELKDVLELYKRDAMMSTNCHAMATVISFNPNDTNLTPPRPTVTAMLNYPRTVFYPDSLTGQQYQTIPYSQLVSVPLVTLSGGGGNAVGGASLTFPVAAGDQIMILFNDRSIDNWKNGNTVTITGSSISGGNTPCSSSRVHHLSDGVALIGFPQFPATTGALPAYDQDRAILANGVAQVGVNASNSKVLITNDPNKVDNLYGILANLITAIENMTMSQSVSYAGTVSGTVTTGPGAGGTVTGTCTITSGNSGKVTSDSALESARTALQGLLE
jgi:Phage protein Gp138 N-terminal domain